MKYVSTDVAKQLLANADVVNLVSDRVYFEGIPQGASYPLILVSDISLVPEYVLQGEVDAQTSQIQVDYWTDGQDALRGPKKAKEGGELIASILSGYRGQLGEETDCKSCRIIRNNILASQPLPGSDIHRRYASMDFEIISSTLATA